MFARFLSELRRRKVISVMVGYSVGAYMVLGAAQAIAPALTLPEWTPSLVLVAAIALAPVVAYLAWFFEFTPRGLKRVPRHAAETRPRPLSALHWLGLLVIAAAAIGSGVLGFAEIRHRQARVASGAGLETPEDKSLAVMVFNDLSPDKDLGYLAEGLAEELSSALGRTPGLQVAAVSSTQRFRDRTDPPAAIGKELGVATLLQGSVRLDGSRMVITANLVDAPTGKTRWSQTYKRPLDDIFKVQEEIAQSILNRIMDNYVAPEGTTITGHATSTDAYVMYLRGREAFRKRTPESIKEARKYFEQAAGLDPEYAPAYVGIADTVRWLARGVESYGDLDPAIAAELARRNVDKALLRDPKLPEAYAALGNVQAMGGRNDEALAAYDKAVALNPNYADAFLWRFLVLRNMARNADALASLETAKKLDPLSPVILKNWAIEKARRKEVPAALAVFDKLIELDPQSPVGYRGAAEVAYASGDFVRSAGYYREVLKRSPDTQQFREALGDIFLNLGLPDAAARLLDKDDYRVNLVIAAGDHAAALDMIHFDHAAKPDDALLSFETAWYEMLWGDREHGRALLRSLDATILQTGWFDRLYCSPHIEMAYAFPEGPDRRRWLETCKSYVREQMASGYSYPELSYMSARVAALEGNTAEARKAFVEAVATGWRQAWTAYDPLLAGIMREPAVKQALQTLTGDLARQKSLVAEKARLWGYL